MSKRRAGAGDAETAEHEAAARVLAEGLAEGKIYDPRDAEAETLKSSIAAWEERAKTGRALREAVPRAAHGQWTPAPDRPDPLDLIEASNKGRVLALVKLRIQRMAASPFAFFRGAACVMAWDLSKTPNTGLEVVIDGDCHVDNFGLFGTPQGQVILDLNDFDETTVGPWEWDLKRLCASVDVAARANGVARKARRKAVIEVVDGYRWAMSRLACLPVIDLWHLHTVPQRMDRRQVKPDKKSAAMIGKAVEKAKASNNATMLAHAAKKNAGGHWRIRLDPPETQAVTEALRKKIIRALEQYVETLAPERQYMIRRYHAVDVAQIVVGVGSVGLRAYMVLLIGNGDDDGLFLQLKEAVDPAAAPYLPKPPAAFANHGQRVVYGQRLLQAAGDPLLGWTMMEGRAYYVRQLKNFKGAIPSDSLHGRPLGFFAFGYGSLLARGHARAGDAAVIAGYCGESDALDEAMADWAEAYGEQTVADHARFLKETRK